MGRESSDALEQAALSFLSGIDPALGLDAALFVRRTGLVVASWMREGIRLDVVSVMAATMLASVDTIIESVGGPTPDVISVDTDAHQILATKVNSRAFLVVIAPKKVRSEEHTSELQSLTNLVCRLLLEKKKKKTE